MTDVPDVTDPADRRRIQRRRLLGGAAALGVGVPLLAACGSDDARSATTPAPTQSSSPSGDEPASEPADDSGGQLVATADVPVGGGVVLDPEKVVVTQPSEGEFKAFTSVCTHQGCVVAAVADNEIACPCHGSLFSAEDGSVITGPATAPLTAIEVKVQGQGVVRA
jgi:Rieske Fe-S protein